MLATQTSGEVSVHGTVAYTNQDPWIQNKILRDNVLAGRPLDQELYQATLSACGLTQDLKVRPCPPAPHTARDGALAEAGAPSNANAGADDAAD